MTHLLLVRHSDGTYQQPDGTFGPRDTARIVTVTEADHGLVLPPDCELVSFRGGEP